MWGDICGWYHFPAGLTDARARMMLGAGAEVFVRGGQLTVRLLTPIPAVYRGFPLHPDDADDPYAFRIDLTRFGIGTARIVFSHDPLVGDTALHLDLMPLSLHKQPDATNPRRWAAGALAVAASTVAVRRFRAIRHRSRG